MRSEFDGRAPPSSSEALTVLENDVRFGSKADMCGAKEHVRFTPKADMRSAQAHVCFGPKADIGASDVEDGIGYFPGIIIGISAGIAEPPSWWKVGRS